MTVYFEHANMHVKDIEAMIKFIQCALPSFKIRFDSGKDDHERWVHIGDSQTYLALNQATIKSSVRPQPYSGIPQINHLGFVVDDVKKLSLRLEKGGYKNTTIQNSHQGRKRIYFNDPEGNDWEFIEYNSKKKELKNDYILN